MLIIRYNCYPLDLPARTKASCNTFQIDFHFQIISGLAYSPLGSMTPKQSASRTSKVARREISDQRLGQPRDGVLLDVPEAARLGTCVIQVKSFRLHSTHILHPR
jgi:hypothetical protein